MEQLTQIKLPTPYEPHLIEAHPAQSVFAYAANYTVFVYQNSELLFEYNCSSVPVEMVFSEDFLKILTQENTLVIIDFVNELLISEHKYEEEVLFILPDTIIFSDKISNNGDTIDIKNISVLSACEFMDQVVLLEGNGDIYTVNNKNSLDFRTNYESNSPFQKIVAKNNTLCISCDTKFVLMNEQFEVVKEYNIEEKIKEFALSDDEEIVYQLENGKIDVVE